MNAVALIAMAAAAWAKDTYLQQFDLVGYGLIAGVAFALRGVLRPPAIVMGAYLSARALWYSSETHGLVTELWCATAIQELRWVPYLAGALGFAVACRNLRPTLFTWAVPLWSVLTMLGYPLVGSNLSLNASFLVAGLCFVERAYLTVVGVLVGGVVVFCNFGSTAVVMLGLFGALYFGVRRIKEAILIAGIAVPYKIWLQPSMFVETERMRVWRAAWEIFKEHIDPWVGSGLGSMMAFGPMAQMKAGLIKPGETPKEFWLSLHSDWLQLGFETGAVGLALGLWLFLDSVWRANHPTRVALILMSVCAIGYYPTHVPIMMVFCAWLVARAQLRRCHQ